MTAGFIIPFRGQRFGKTRLRAAMPAAAVDVLSERMLANVLRAVRGAALGLPVVVITRARAALRAPAGVTILEQPLDHNDAIEFARATLVERGVSRVVVVASDLPLIQPADIRALLNAKAEVVIAADAPGQGTNALIFPATEAEFNHFGIGSAQRHAWEAEKRHLTVAHVHTAALAHDVDTVDQIDDAVRAACMPAWSRD